MLHMTLHYMLIITQKWTFSITLLPHLKEVLRKVKKKKKKKKKKERKKEERKRNTPQDFVARAQQPSVGT